MLICKSGLLPGLPSCPPCTGFADALRFCGSRGGRTSLYTNTPPLRPRCPEFVTGNPLCVFLPLSRDFQQPSALPRRGGAWDVFRRRVWFLRRRRLRG